MELSAGKHSIYYVAADEAGNKARCHFTIELTCESSLLHSREYGFVVVKITCRFLDLFSF